MCVDLSAFNKWQGFIPRAFFLREVKTHSPEADTGNGGSPVHPVRKSGEKNFSLSWLTNCLVVCMLCVFLLLVPLFFSPFCECV